MNVVMNVLDYLQRPHLIPRCFFDKFAIARKLHCLQDVVVDKESNGTVTAIDIDLAEGRYVLVGESDGSICLYDLFLYFSFPFEKSITLPRICQSKGEGERKSFLVSSLRWFTADNGMFFSLQRFIKNNRVSIWDTNLFTEEQVIEYQDIPIYQLAPSSAIAKQPLLALGTDRKVLLLDIRVGQRAVQQLKGWDSGVSCLEWCPNVDYCLATGTLDGDLCLVDWRKPQQHNRLVTMNPYRSSLSNSKQQEPVLIKPMNQDNSSVQRKLCWFPSSTTVHFWNKSVFDKHYSVIDNNKRKYSKVSLQPLENNNNNIVEEFPIHRAHSSSIQSICFLWNGLYMSSQDREGDIHIWDTLTGSLVHSLSCNCLPKKKKMKNASKGISIVCDNKTLIYALDRSLYSFDAIHGKHTTTIQTLGTEITASTCHPWEPLLLCGSRNSELIFFGVEDNIYLQKQLPLGVVCCKRL